MAALRRLHMPPAESIEGNVRTNTGVRHNSHRHPSSMHASCFDCSVCTSAKTLRQVMNAWPIANANKRWREARCELRIWSMYMMRASGDHPGPRRPARSGREGFRPVKVCREAGAQELGKTAAALKVG